MSPPRRSATSTCSSLFGDRVGLAHGQQTPEVRDAALAAFAAGTIRLLVATTVVEVGVDVPEASVMVIEHAERFGLAQLHQLRGRVGRGAEASFCLLLHEDWVNETARRRLTLLRDTEDGFLIADEDFRLRGGGDALGHPPGGAARLPPGRSGRPRSTCCTWPIATPRCCCRATRHWKRRAAERSGCC